MSAPNKSRKSGRAKFWRKHWAKKPPSGRSLDGLKEARNFFEALGYVKPKKKGDSQDDSD